MAKIVYNADGTLYNHRHELFCNNMVMGCSHKDALIAAGFAAGKGCHANALKLMQRTEIAQRLEDLRKEQKDMYLLTKTQIIEELGKIVLGDKSADSNKIKACDLVGKMMGYHKAKEQKLTVKTDVNNMSDEELEAYLKDSN